MIPLLSIIAYKLNEVLQYQYFPFGGGNHRCIDMAFAQFEMKLILVTVLSRWQMALADSKPVQLVRQGLLLAPAHGVQMLATEVVISNQ